jgi:Fe-S cluster assembly protein SufD
MSHALRQQQQQPQVISIAVSRCSCKHADPFSPAIACFCLVQGQQSNTRGGPFAVLNGSMVADVLVVALPAGAKLQQPLHVLHVSTPAAAAADGSSSGPALNASAARLLVSLGANASAEVVEEFVSDAEGSHVSMPVAEVVLGEGSELKHGYVHREASGAQHFKATLVKQVRCGLRGSFCRAFPISAACLTETLTAA